jgi:hypothetical protein
MMGYMRIAKRNWYRAGGFRNSLCVRVTRGRAWAYFWGGSF